MTPQQIAKKFSTAKPGESIEAAMTRSLSFARAMIAAGHEDVLVTGMAPHDRSDRIANVAKAVESAASVPKPSGKHVGALVQAKKRFGAPLPPSLHTLWTVLASTPHRTWLRAFCARSLVDPTLLLPPPAFARDAILTTVWSKDRSSVSDTRERFSNDYEEWFAEAGPTVAVSDGAQLGKHKRGAWLMLDPALRHTNITFAHASSEHWFVATGLASKKYPEPVFSNHDDAEGRSQLHAADVRTWFSGEITASIKAVLEEQ